MDWRRFLNGLEEICFLIRGKFGSGEGGVQIWGRSGIIDHPMPFLLTSHQSLDKCLVFSSLCSECGSGQRLMDVERGGGGGESNLSLWLLAFHLKTVLFLSHLLLRKANGGEGGGLLKLFRGSGRAEMVWGGRQSGIADMPLVIITCDQRPSLDFCGEEVWEGSCGSAVNKGGGSDLYLSSLVGRG